MLLYFLDVYFTYSLQLFICILYIMTEDTLPSKIYDVKSNETHSTPKKNPPPTYIYGFASYYINRIKQLDIDIKPCYYAYKEYTSLLKPDTKKNYAHLNFDCLQFIKLLREQNFDLNKNEKIFYPLYLRFIDHLKKTRSELTELSEEISHVRMDLESRKENVERTQILILNEDISQLGEVMIIILNKLININNVLSDAHHDTNIQYFKIEYNPYVNYKEYIAKMLQSTVIVLGGKAKNKKAKKSTKNRKTKNKKAKRRTKRRTKN